MTPFCSSAASKKKVTILKTTFPFFASRNRDGGYDETSDELIYNAKLLQHISAGTLDWQLKQFYSAVVIIVSFHPSYHDMSENHRIAAQMFQRVVQANFVFA